MRKVRAKALRKELQEIMEFMYNNQAYTQRMWRAFKRNYVRN